MLDRVSSLSQVTGAIALLYIVHVRRSRLLVYRGQVEIIAVASNSLFFLSIKEALSNTFFLGEKLHHFRDRVEFGK